MDEFVIIINERIMPAKMCISSRSPPKMIWEIFLCNLHVYIPFIRYKAGIMCTPKSVIYGPLPCTAQYDFWLELPTPASFVSLVCHTCAYSQQVIQHFYSKPLNEVVCLHKTLTWIIFVALI